MMKMNTTTKMIQVPQSTVISALAYLKRVHVHNAEEEHLCNVYATLQSALGIDETYFQAV